MSLVYPEAGATPPPLEKTPEDPANPCDARSEQLWQLYCQPAFVRITRDVAAVKQTLFVGDNGNSVLARLHSHSRMLSILLMIQLAYLTALLAIFTTQLTIRRDHAAAIAPSAPASATSQVCDMEKDHSLDDS